MLVYPENSKYTPIMTAPVFAGVGSSDRYD